MNGNTVWFVRLISTECRVNVFSTLEKAQSYIEYDLRGCPSEIIDPLTGDIFDGYEDEFGNLYEIIRRKVH